MKAPCSARTTNNVYGLLTMACGKKRAAEPIKQMISTLRWPTRSPTLPSTKAAMDDVTDTDAVTAPATVAMLGASGASDCTCSDRMGETTAAPKLTLAKAASSANELPRSTWRMPANIGRRLIARARGSG